MKRTGIFFASTSGNTEKAAWKVRDAIGLSKEDQHNVMQADAATLEKYDVLIFGIPTWGVGELHEDWEGFLPELEKVDFSSRKVALFGLGDQEGNPDSFCDAMGLIGKRLKEMNANLIGYWPTDDYEFDQSEAREDGHFIGLALDEDNEPEKTDNRIQQWVKDIWPELE